MITSSLLIVTLIFVFIILIYVLKKKHIESFGYVGDVIRTVKKTATTVAKKATNVAKKATNFVVDGINYANPAKLIEKIKNLGREISGLKDKLSNALRDATNIKN